MGNGRGDPTILLQQPPDVVSSDPLQQQPPVATVSQPPAVDFQQFPPDVVPGRSMEAFGGGGDATYMNQDHQPMYANDNGNSGQATSQKLPSYTNEGGKNSAPWSAVVCHELGRKFRKIGTNSLMLFLKEKRVFEKLILKF